MGKKASYNVFVKGHHSWDTKGLRFAIALSLAVCTGGVGFNYALSELTAKLYPVAESKIVISEPKKDTLTENRGLASAPEQRVIDTLTIAQATPQEGKFIAADLQAMRLYLIENGSTTAEYPIKMKGRAGTPWETPAGFYQIQTKEESHFSTIGKVYMPYSMQFYGNYFIHGMTYYPDGTPTSATFSGGCIKLETEDAARVFAFADIGTKVFVYDPKTSPNTQPLALMDTGTPQIEAESFIAADIDTGDVYIERGAQDIRPIASVTKLMTTLVANETISLDKKITVAEGYLLDPPNHASSTPKTFLVNDLFYPLLLQESNGVAEALAGFYGSKSFVRWMNTTARALGMTSTTFDDASGISIGNISNTEDLFRLARYLSDKKSFVLNITKTPTKKIVAEDGEAYVIRNLNAPASSEPFIGGKSGKTEVAKETMLSVLTFKHNGETRRIGIAVLSSTNQAKDTESIAKWIMGAVHNDSQSACAACTIKNSFRKIEP